MHESRFGHRILYIPAFLGFLIVGSALARAEAPALTCQQIAQGVRSLDLLQGKEVSVEPGGRVTFREAFRECDKRDSFNGQSLPSGRKCSTDKNRVDRLLVLPDKTLIVTAKAGVDADGSPLARSPNRPRSSQKETSLLNGRSLDAEATPFIVMPGALEGPHLNARTNVAQGDLAIVIKGDHCSFAIVGDTGPYFRFGEISMAAHEDLGSNQCRENRKPCPGLRGRYGEGISTPSGVTYVIFPNSKPEGLTAQNARQMAALHGQVRVQKFLADNATPSQ
ncbi:glycoside hydrolase family 75 protein [Cupriavidus sp. UME77]|uniref:glycoside hydrolase family 75 protein n=1 Tax=Cupriavidus sp. UME77 TaxID=1862321 RepID=UPI001601170E|nr:glycoside hydrolase family 75 protein [Cupriavidus sp. UME77]MBB1631349.1 hypothetical protein [Cupriavidus sp. UME77]